MASERTHVLDFYLGERMNPNARVENERPLLLRRRSSRRETSLAYSRRARQPTLPMKPDSRH